jgi:hypothetical protein
LVRNIVFDYHGDLVPVVMELLKEVQERYEVFSQFGSYIEPGSSLRCDGVDQSHPNKPDLSAAFICFPYFDTAAGQPQYAPKDEALHYPRGLFQSSYTQEPARDRDADQMFRSFNRSKNRHYLRVPQLWAIVLQSTTIITCGPSKLSDMFEDEIKFFPEAELQAQGPSLVHVTDYFRKITYLQLDKCKTFLALRQQIEEECFTDTDHSRRDYRLHSGYKQEELEADQWPALVKNAKSAFVYVRISQSNPTASLPNPSLEIAEPQKSLAINYMDLSSDDSSIDGGDRQIALLRPKR